MAIVPSSTVPALADAPEQSRGNTRRHDRNRRRDARRRRLLALADLCAGLCFAVALHFAGAPRSQALVAVALLPLWPFLAKLDGLYDRDHRALYTTTTDELATLAGWGIVGTALVAAVTSALTDTSVGVQAYGWAWATVTVAAVVLRAAVRAAWRVGTPRERTLVVGSGELAETVRRKIDLLPQLHQEVVATWSSRRLDEAVANGMLPDDLDRIVIASSALDEAQLLASVGLCRSHGMKLSVVPPVQVLLGGAVQLSRAADLPVLDYNTWDPSRSTLALKRAIDVAIGTCALVVAAPLMPLIAAAIVLDTRGPVLFSQQRVGLNGREFRMRKFRTMVRNAEDQLPELVDLDRLPEPVFKLRADPRTTRVGRRLRRLSLDELPQLWNVIRGEMSLVGPRPEQVELVARYDETQDVRFHVRPGMTGPMQIYGRGHLSLDERLAVERDYVENLSLRRDLKILLLTLPAVVVGRGAF